MVFPNGDIFRLPLEKLDKNLCSQLSSAPPEVPPCAPACAPGNYKGIRRKSQGVSIRDNPYGDPLETIV